MLAPGVHRAQENDRRCPLPASLSRCTFAMRRLVLLPVIALLAVGCSTTPPARLPAAPLPAQLAQHIKAFCPGVLSESAGGTSRLQMHPSVTDDRCKPGTNEHVSLFKKWCSGLKGNAQSNWEGQWCVLGGQPVAGETYEREALAFSDGAKLKAKQDELQLRLNAELSKHRSYVRSPGMRGTISTRDGNTYQVVRLGTLDGGPIDYGVRVAEKQDRVSLHNMRQLSLAKGVLTAVLINGTTEQSQVGAEFPFRTWEKTAGDRTWTGGGDPDPGNGGGKLVLIALIQRDDGMQQYARFQTKDVVAMSLRRDDAAPAPVLKLAAVDAAALRAMRSWVAARTPAWVKKGTTKAYVVLPDGFGDNNEPGVCRIVYKPLSLIAYCNQWGDARSVARRQGYWSSEELAFVGADGDFDNTL